ncbi:hypothetical protein H6P81_008197 [Aristolochia fimbriata]|uniref:Uncharacterized protein n=1 Tax=Aristolochia fimbriata TaxID=158543 RepID=A0AAV7F2N9_ARIFI|nr:hypothetical protein H6P81_008197 [Aristolochia fimbriata]
MSSALPSLSPISYLHARRKLSFRSTESPRKTLNFRRYGKNRNLSSDGDSQSENLVLKLAWFGSELLGIAASLFRSPADAAKAGGEVEVTGEEELGVMGRAQLVDAIREDFKRSYFVTGNLTLNAYEEDCEFADPAGSFKGLRRFKRNCSNFGSLLIKSDMKLMKWEDFEDKGVGHWRFSCVMSFPWRPILSATGYTEYYFDDQSGKVCRHVEHWNVPKMALLRQIFRPSQSAWGVIRTLSTFQPDGSNFVHEANCRPLHLTADDLEPEVVYTESRC